MALTSANVYAALSAARASGGFPFAGVSFNQMAWGIATGVTAWGLYQPQNLAMTGWAVGTSGTGVVTGKVLVPPTVTLISAALLAAGMAGPLSPSLATVVTVGISQAFSTFGQYSGVASGVGTGSDVSKVAVSNAATLIAALQAAMAASMGAGPALPQMTTGLGNGIAALLLLGTGTGVVTGSSGSAASGGTFSVVL